MISVALSSFLFSSVSSNTPSSGTTQYHQRMWSVARSNIARSGSTDDMNGTTTPPCRQLSRREQLSPYLLLKMVVRCGNSVSPL